MADSDDIKRDEDEVEKTDKDHVEAEATLEEDKADVQMKAAADKREEADSK